MVCVAQWQGEPLVPAEARQWWGEPLVFVEAGSPWQIPAAGRFSTEGGVTIRHCDAAAMSGGGRSINGAAFSVVPSL